MGSWNKPNNESGAETRRVRSAMLGALAALAVSTGAAAHDLWANETPVPAWVKGTCCGPADAHHLRADQVRRISDEYYEVDGYFSPVPAREALPSQDGDYWIFYKTNKSGSQTGVFYFFAPKDF
jgi:hypothetical protein